MALKGEDCIYYPCEKARRIGITACMGCEKYLQRNPKEEAELDFLGNR